MKEFAKMIPIRVKLNNTAFSFCVYVSFSFSRRLDAFENQIIRILNKVHASIDRNEQRLTEQERRELMEMEWKQTSIVLDRMLLCIFLLVTIVSTTTILCRSPPPD